MRKILMLVCFLIVAGCKSKDGGAEKMLHSEKVNRIHCVGRHLIKLPEYFMINPVSTGSFRNAGSDAGGRVFDVVVHHGKRTLREFDAEMQRRRGELRAADDGTVDVFEFEKSLRDDAIIFRVRKIDDAYVSEMNFLRGESLITIKMDSFKNQYSLAEDALVKFSEGVAALSEEQGSRRSDGFCLGLVTISGKFDLEFGSVSFMDGKGQNFEVDIDTYAPDDKVPLLKRMTGPDSLLSVFQVNHTVLRARERTVAGMKAQEWLGWARISEEEGKTLKFALDTMRSKPGKDAPSLQLTFNTAQPLHSGMTTKTVMSDDEAVQLWDAVVSSIQLVNAR
jgi:hypothetical protein